MNIDQLQVKAEQILDDYEKESGVPPFTMFDSSEVDPYFNMSMDQLGRLSPVKCAEIAYMLAQYSFYLQRVYNRESSKQRWTENQMAKLVCNKMGDYDKYMKYDHKIALIAKENDVVERLERIISYTTQMMDRMNFLSTSIKNMCEIMSNLQRAKSYSNKVVEYES